MKYLLQAIKELFQFQSRTQTAHFPGIIAAKVLEVQKHPNADRLRVVKLDMGGKIVEPIVCGAWNFEAGDLVALALPGAVIPHNIHSEAHDSFTLGKAKIRGIESQGMICSGYELGIGPLSENPEIILLKQGVVAGSEFKPDMVL